MKAKLIQADLWQVIDGQRWWTVYIGDGRGLTDPLILNERLSGVSPTSKLGREILGTVQNWMVR